MVDALVTNFHLPSRHWYCWFRPLPVINTP
ncbi:hypothetical protein ACLB1Q_13880 [Escherichia coli]